VYGETDPTGAHISQAKATEKISTDQEKRMFKNIQQAMAVELQDLSATFRKVQANYLTRMWPLCRVVWGV
jgi:hypothetical protein